MTENVILYHDIAAYWIVEEAMAASDYATGRSKTTLLMQGAAARLAGALVIILLLWAAVGWALDWWS